MPWLESIRHSMAIGAPEGLRRLAQALPVLVNLPGLLGYVRTIRTPHAHALTSRYPRLAYKWLGNSLSLAFSPRQRLQIAISHYRWLQDHTREGVLGALFDTPLVVWAADIDSHRLTLQLGFPHPDDQEGDLSLTLTMDGHALCMTSFVVCAGALVGAAAAHVIFVARIQGGVGNFGRVREATRTCHDIAPADLLMAALAGLAQAFGIDNLVGVPTRDQVSREDGPDDPPFFDYDGFWSGYGSRRAADGLHHIALPFAERPLDEIRCKHRSRTRRKREFKGLLARAVYHCGVQQVRAAPAVRRAA